MLPFKLFEKPFDFLDVRGATRYSVRKKECIILVNGSLDQAQKRLTLKHELSHILLNHFEREEEPIQLLEKEAEDYAANMTEEEFEALMAYRIN